MRSLRFRNCLMPLLLVFTGALSSCGGDEFVAEDQPSPQGGAAGAGAAAGSSGQAGAIGGSAGVDGGAGASGHAGSAGGPTGGAAGSAGAGQGGQAGSGIGGANTGGANTGGANTGGANTGGASTGGANTGGANTGGASTGGANTGGANTGGANTGGMAGGSPGETQCMDKVDNENDGAVDCADSECMVTHRCVNALPPGWLSIGYLNMANPSASCPTNFPAKLLLKKVEDLPSQPEDCQCSCSNGGSVCTSFAYCGNSCMSSTSMAYTVGEFCDSFGNGAALACSFTAPVPKGGNCLPTFNKPALAWPDTARFCHRDPQQGYGSCAGSGQACVPKAPATEIGPCLASTGDVQCPSPGMSRYVMGTDPVSDNRTCDCACGDIIGGSCSGGNQVYLYADGACSSTDYKSIPADGNCVSIAAENNAATLSAAQIVQPPTCAVNGTRKTNGQITYPKYTFCCAQ